MNKLSDQWRTPDCIFEKLDSEFNFDIDLCANKENSKCKYYCSDYLRDELNYVGNDYDALLLNWYLKDTPSCCFMNPPYSNPKPFIEKAWEDSKHCKIVLLVKVDTSTRWWAVFWDYLLHKPKPGCARPRYFDKRVQFDPPIKLVKSGKVWKEGKHWVKNCDCEPYKHTTFYIGKKEDYFKHDRNCSKCKGKGYVKLPGTSFPACVLIFDRRGI